MPPVKIALTISLLAVTAAYADELDPIDPAAIMALKEAYPINGNSMVGWNSIDLSDVYPLTPIPETVRTGPGNPDTTATVPPAPLSAVLSVVKRRRHAEANICTIHHMRKVYTDDGTSWRCRK